MTRQLTETEILARLREVARQPEATKRLPLEVVNLLKENFPHYDWVGIYNMEGEDELVLGPFLGKPSPHSRIKIGSGVCGAAAREKSTIIVDDVNADPRYLACSIETRSEIVVPILKEGQVCGEIDIDSHRRAAFTHLDRHFLEQVSEILAIVY